MRARCIHFVTTSLCALVLISTTNATAQVLNADAQKRFDAGVAYVEDPTGSKWEDALKEFRAAYAASPTWKLMNNIGLCALNLERDGEAIEAFQTYLDHASDTDFTPKQRKQMEKDIAMLSTSLVRVALEFQPSEALLLDERRNAKGALLVNQYAVTGGKASLGIHSGLHKFTLMAPGYVTKEWTFVAEPSSSHQHQFKLAPEGNAGSSESAPATAPTTAAGIATPNRTAEHHTPTLVYVGLAATGVFAAAATVTGVVTMGKAKDFDNASDPAERHDLASSGKTFSWLTNIGAGAAILSAGATAYVYFTSKQERPVATSSTTRASSIRLLPVAAPSAGGIAIFGNF